MNLRNVEKRIIAKAWTLGYFEIHTRHANFAFMRQVCDELVKKKLLRRCKAESWRFHYIPRYGERFFNNLEQIRLRMEAASVDNRPLAL